MCTILQVFTSKLSRKGNELFCFKMKGKRRYRIGDAVVSCFKSVRLAVESPGPKIVECDTSREGRKWWLKPGKVYRVGGVLIKLHERIPGQRLILIHEGAIAHDRKTEGDAAMVASEPDAA